MKLVSYQHLDQPGWGLVTDAGLVPLHSASYPTLLSALQAGQLDAIAAQARAPALPLARVRFLPGIPARGRPAPRPAAPVRSVVLFTFRCVVLAGGWFFFGGAQKVGGTPHRDRA